MNEVRTDYVINPETCILLPAKQIAYDTIIIEQGKKLFVKKTAWQLIEEACIKYGSTYDGRKGATSYQTDFFRKVPIPISIRRDIYAFPTHAVTDFECAWIFPNHVQFTQPIPPVKQGDKKKSLIVFKNDKKLSLDVSQHVLKKQWERTEICKYIFTDGIRW